jgi:hypothetical protein
VKDFFQCEHRGRILTKDKQEREMYLVRGIQPALRAGMEEGELPPQFQRRYKTYFRGELKAFPRVDDLLPPAAE